ncbi:MAG: hypothetical protein JO324_06570 [Candidatus Eremiobacteraeota bacterium]|nr:hypothetical protein [Candidatus Eremiobacteraeota bacterium]
MVQLTLAAALLALLPSPAPTERPPLKTIITVVSSPYCNSLVTHFNGALVPMLGNDRAIEVISVQLDNLNQLFSDPNYQQEFVDVRTKLLHQESKVNESLAAIEQEIDLLRDGAKLTTDPQAQADIKDAATQLHTAWARQRELAIDLHHMYQEMTQYPIEQASNDPGGFAPEDMREPAEMKDIKSYLRFNTQIKIIANSEDKAVEIAYNTAQTYCIPKK